MTDHGTEVIEAFEERARRREDRRAFFKAFGAAAAVTGGIAVASAASAQSAPSDSDILNFALNLEYLESAYYQFAVNGGQLPASMMTGTGKQGAATGGRQVDFSGDPVVAAFAKEVAADEAAHVAFIRSTLGSAAIAQPAIDVSPAVFTKIVNSGGVAGTFDPYASPNNFMLAGALFEDIGVTAYNGAATLLSSKTYLDAAAGILAVEAYHASIFRTTLYARSIQLPAPTIVAYSQAITNAENTVDKPDNAAQAIVMNGQTNIVPADANSLAFTRPANRVLNLAYLTAQSVTMGGFFPAGVNGAINTSAAN